ncbi:unnamed protein product [Phyllotreta striolata]|uniref:Uncharacterized protein n=1 Tax=Phyllotreta striolata TaxID=444603 RepID=A0A9N9XTW0_PHYSR|nr:unnamed protein product [Phyllotreta striolata]
MITEPDERFEDETEEDICCPLCPTISCLFNRTISSHDLDQDHPFYMEPTLPFPNLTYPTEEILYHILGEYACLIDHYPDIFVDDKPSELDGALAITIPHLHTTSTQTKRRKTASTDGAAAGPPYKLDMELRGGKFIPCICGKSHGLQDFCERTGCMGSPDCLRFPPECLPALFQGRPQRVVYPRTKLGLSETVGVGGGPFRVVGPFVDGSHSPMSADCGCCECLERDAALWLKCLLQAQLGYCAAAY